MGEGELDLGVGGPRVLGIPDDVFHGKLERCHGSDLEGVDERMVGKILYLSVDMTIRG